VNRELIRSTAFIRAARRYLKKHPRASDEFEATLLLLSQDAFDPRLKTHKLKGDLDGVWVDRKQFEEAAVWLKRRDVAFNGLSNFVDGVSHVRPVVLSLFDLLASDFAA